MHKLTKHKFEHNKPYYIVYRLTYQKHYKWVDEDRTFNTLKEAEDYIQLIAGQGVKGSMNKFTVYKVQSIEHVEVNLD